jgi:uncharacterized surface protein with fasciclin (FAS1) repeats
MGTRTRVACSLLVVAVLASACGGDDADEALTVEEAVEQLCTAGVAYVDELDTYGRLFDSSEITVAQVTSGNEAIDDARSTALAAAEDVQAANEAAGATESTVVLSDDALDRIEAAEELLADVIDGLDGDTPLAEALNNVSAAAYATQVTWLLGLAEVGCVDDLDEALATLTAYVAALQADLATLGFYTGPVDGIYGPLTVEAVKALQESAGLLVTGLVDRPTQAAMADLLADQQSAQVAALQGMLASLGYWTGPVDGVWTDELGDALAALQSDLGLPPTGTMDAATLRALQDALAAGLADGDIEEPVATTVAPATTPPPTTPPATTAPVTAPPATAAPTTPPVELATVADVLAADGRFTTLLDAITVAGLTDVLTAAGTFTVFAPTDDAFARLPAGALDGLVADPAALRALLLDHVLSDAVVASNTLLSAGTVQTAGEGTITVTQVGAGLVVNEVAVIITPDMLAANGVVHAIDTVLLPST